MLAELTAPAHLVSSHDAQSLETQSFVQVAVSDLEGKQKLKFPLMLVTPQNLN